MDTKNVVAAISLSAAVIVLYYLFFLPEPTQRTANVSEKNKIEKNSDTPSLDKKETIIKISRDEAIDQNDRVKFENYTIQGSISLKGAIIDDFTFKNYNTELESNENVVLLNPRNIEDGYFIESGFVTSDKNIDIPNSASVWSIEGNNKLTEQAPIKLSWSNKQGITFLKEISLDNQFLCTIKQKVINTSDKKFEFYSYGKIIRNKIPEGLSNFYILNEGMLAELDGELFEED